LSRSTPAQRRCRRRATTRRSRSRLCWPA